MELLFRGPWFFAIAIAFAGCAQAYWAYCYRQPRHWSLFGFRIIAFALLSVLLAQPAMVMRNQATSGAPIHIVVDRTASVRDDFPADLWLPFVEKLSSTNIVHVHFGDATGIQNQATFIPAAGDTREQFAQLSSRFKQEHSHQADLASSERSGWAMSSPIADWILESKTLQSAEQQAAVVLFSDGQANSGTSASDASKRLKDSSLSLFPFIGRQAEAMNDIALVDFEVPNQHFVGSTVRGKILVRASSTTTRPIDLTITAIGSNAAGNDAAGNNATDSDAAGKKLWSTRIYSGGTDILTVPFEFPASTAIPSSSAVQPAKLRQSQVVPLVCKVDTSITTDRIENNTLLRHTVISEYGSRVLIVDSLPRWETRYLRNLFQRDPAWECECIVARQVDERLSDATTQSQAEEERAETNALSKVDFSNVDLVIWGDAPEELLPASKLEQFVAEVRSGLGVVFLDGQNKHLHSSKQLLSLLPIVPSKNTGGATTDPEQPTDELPQRQFGVDLPSVDFNPLHLGAFSDWPSLPKLVEFDEVSPSLGAEVLLTASDMGRRRPLLLKSMCGRGKVLYWATDQTWRWRYRHADRLHGLLWMQLARWAMRAPPNVSDDRIAIYVAPLHSIGPNKDTCDSFEIGCQFKGAIPQDVAAEILAADQSIVATVPLVCDNSLSPPDNRSGGSASADQLSTGLRFSGVVPGMAAGDYSIRIRSDLQSASAGSPAKIVVFEPPSTELLNLGINRKYLERLAAAGGGQAVNDPDELIGLLGELRGSRVSISEQPLWQSWPLFICLVGALAAELIIRRRSGLL